MKRTALKNFKPQKSFLICFTLLFIIAAAAAFSPFIIFKTSLVWENEGLSQYYTAIIYWGKYLRAFAKNLLGGQFILPQYDFSIGLGEDIISALGLYVIGDPFALLSAAVPSRFEAYFVSLLAVFRLYAAGISFGLLARCKKIRAPFAALGALVYSFCGFALTQGINCQYCINPLIYFPLIVLGIDRIFDGKRPYILIFSIFLAGIGNTYFFFQLSVFALLFLILRAMNGTYKGSKAKAIIKIICCYLLGTLCAMALLLPMLNAVFNCYNSFNIRLLFSADYYLSILPAFMSSAYIEEGGLSLGFTAAGLFAIILLLSKKKEGAIFKKALLCGLFILTPAIAFPLSFNGNVQVSWLWALALPVCFIIANEFQSAEKIEIKSYLTALCVAAAIGIYCICIKQARSEESFAQLIILAAFAGSGIIFSIAAKSGKSTRGFKEALAVLCVIAVCTSGLYRFAYTEPSNGSSFRAAVPSDASFDYANEFSGANSWKPIKQLQRTDSTVARYDGAFIERRDYNNAIINESYGTMEYFALANPFVKQLQDEVQSARSFAGTIEPSFGDRYLEAIKNVRYFAALDKRLMADGYSDEALESFEKTDVRSTEKVFFRVFENKNYIPFGYVYTDVIDEYDYWRLTPAEKRIALTKGIVINDSEASSTHSAEGISTDKLDFTLEAGDNAVIDENGIHTYARNAKVIIKTNAPANNALYLNLDAVNFSPLSKKEAIIKYNAEELEGLTKSAKAEKLFEISSSAKVTKTVIDINTDCKRNSREIAAPRNNNYIRDCNFSVNLGSYAEPLDEIVLNLSAIGDYSIDISLEAHTLQDYEADLAALRESTVDNLKIETDKFSGTITSDNGGWLYFSLPYSPFWSASVDGESAEIRRANTAFSAIEIEGGTHEIEFKYGNPYLEKGAALSAIGIGIFAAAVVANELAIRKRRAENEK